MSLIYQKHSEEETKEVKIDKIPIFQAANGPFLIKEWDPKEEILPDPPQEVPKKISKFKQARMQNKE